MVPGTRISRSKPSPLSEVFVACFFSRSLLARAILALHSLFLSFFSFFGSFVDHQRPFFPAHASLPKTTLRQSFGRRWVSAGQTLTFSLQLSYPSSPFWAESAGPGSAPSLRLSWSTRSFLFPFALYYREPLFSSLVWPPILRDRNRASSFWK